MTDREEMRLVSVSVGLPKTVQWRDQPVTTGIFKSPVEGPVALRKHNLDGDQQTDLSVHVGPAKAVYVYPIRHYTYWRGELPDVDLGWGHCGENFSVVRCGAGIRAAAAGRLVAEPGEVAGRIAT